MYKTKDLKQLFYCPECEDFYDESSFVIKFPNVYFTSSFIGCSAGCPKGHRRQVNKQYQIYLPEQPIKNNNSSIICFDMINFSEKSQIFQFNNISILHAACIEILSDGFSDAIYKGTGDGFILGLPSYDVSKAIEFCEILIKEYLGKIDFIRYRIGIDYGLFFSYRDLQKRKDIMGQLVIDVTRVANFGNANHILLSENAANNLIENGDKRKEYLTELGICLAKHRIPYKIYNFHLEPVGAEYKISQK